MTSGLAKRIALAAIATIGFLLYSFWRSEETNFVAHLQSVWPTLLLVLVVGSGWIAAGGFTDQAWDGLKAAFPERFTQDKLPQHVAVGMVKTSVPDADPIGPVMVAAANDGLLIAKLRKKPKVEHFICIPWSRVIRIFVPEPRGLSRCTSSQDCIKLSENLEAQLSISRRDYPAIELTIPWNYMFGSSLPINVDLVRNWEWPYAVQSVI